MKPNTIRMIDIYSGRLICFLLTCHRRVKEFLFQPPNPMPAIKRVLFLKLVEQGATVLAYSAMQETVKKFGRENVFFCVFEENQAILHAMDMIPRENILTARHGNLLLFFKDILGIIYRTRRIGIDATIDMEFFARASAILSYLIGAPYRVGLHRFTSEAPYRGDLLTHRIQYNPYLHTAQTYLLLVRALFMNKGDIPLPKSPVGDLSVQAPVYSPPDQERQAFLRKLESLEIPLSKPVILLNPNASDMLPLRKWSAENFIQLAGKILNAFPKATIIMTGAPSEAESAKIICKEIASPQVFNLAGETTILELLTLYTLADVLVTNDSGPGHFASMTGIHNIVLFGPETHRLFGAIGGHFHPVSAGLACSPCVNVFNHRFSPCNHNRCMESITVEDVFRVVEKCLVS